MLTTNQYRKILRFTSPIVAKLSPGLRLNLARIVFHEGLVTLFDPNSIRNYSHLQSKQSIRKILFEDSYLAYVDINDIMGFRAALNQAWDSTALNIVTRFPKENSLYIDIGANIGLTSIPVALNDYKTIAVEPNPTALKLLVKNLELNNPSRFILAPYALSGDAQSMGFMDLYSPTGNLGASSVHKNWSPGKDAVAHFRVPTTNLDTLLEFLIGESEMDQIENTIIKLDVEGYEDEVISGGQKMCQKMRPIVIFENNIQQYSTISYQRFFEKLVHYQVFGIKMNKFVEFDPSRRYENAIAIPSEKLETLNISYCI